MSPPIRSRQWRLAAHPKGIPRADDFRVHENIVRAPLPGEVCVQVHYLSMDPAPRMRMQALPRMGPTLPLGSVVIGRGAGIVTATTTGEFAIGDAVTGELGWQEHAIVPTSQIALVDSTLAPLRAHLGVLGSSGLTAYLTLHDCVGARSGETVVVSAAAGSVGLAACQIAKLLGCRVVALAHGPSQFRFLVDRLDVDVVIDDTDHAALPSSLAAACPRGVDVFLDSVGGALHDQVMDRIAVRGRAVLYGFISAYDTAADSELQYGRPFQVIRSRAHVMGFLLGDHAARFPSVLAELAAWLRDGRLLAFEAITRGFENVPQAFADLFGEATPGKHLVRLAAATD